MNFTFSQEKIVLQAESYFSLKSIQGFLSNLCDSYSYAKLSPKPPLNFLNSRSD